MGEGTLPWDMLTPGDIFVTNLTTYFTDPDGDMLDYLARSRDPGVLATRTRGSTLTLRAVGEGVTEITVSARDPGNLSASITVVVSVAPKAQADDRRPHDASSGGTRPLGRTE